MIYGGQFEVGDGYVLLLVNRHHRVVDQLRWLSILQNQNTKLLIGQDIALGVGKVESEGDCTRWVGEFVGILKPTMIKVVLNEEIVRRTSV